MLGLGGGRLWRRLGGGGSGWVLEAVVGGVVWVMGRWVVLGVRRREGVEVVVRVEVEVEAEAEVPGGLRRLRKVGRGELCGGGSIGFG